MSDPRNSPGAPSEETLQQRGAMSPALTGRLRALTPARVGLRRTGDSLATGDVLDFQFSHARARDAVHAALDVAGLIRELRRLNLEADASDVRALDILTLHSKAENRRTYLERPDLGRTLDQTSLERLALYVGEKTNPPRAGYDLCITIADGLSALAVERHAAPLLAELLSMVHRTIPELSLSPICVVEQGRVAIGDEVAQVLCASLVIVLIGERPGLSSPDSLGAYITWLSKLRDKSRPTTDADRNCISNIRLEGLSYAQAAARLLFYIREAHRLQLTGVVLKDPDEPEKRLVGGKTAEETAGAMDQVEKRGEVR